MKPVCNVIVHTVAVITSHTPCQRPHEPPSKPYSGTTHDLNTSSCVARYCMDMEDREGVRTSTPRSDCILLAALDAMAAPQWLRASHDQLGYEPQRYSLVRQVRDQKSKSHVREGGRLRPHLIAAVHIVEDTSHMISLRLVAHRLSY